MVIPLSARPVEGQVPGENVHEHVGDEGDVDAALLNTPSRAGGEISTPVRFSRTFL